MTMMEINDIGRKEFYKVIVGFNDLQGKYEVFRTDLVAGQAANIAALLDATATEIAATTAVGAKIDATGVTQAAIAAKLDAANALLTAGNVNTAAIITSLGAKIDLTNIKLDTLAGFTDGLETLDTNLGTKMDAVKTAIDALTAAMMPPGVLTYTATLSALGNPTIKTGSGHIYGFSCGGIVEIRDNTTPKWITIGGTAMPFNPPIPFATSLKLFTTLGSGISLYYD